MSTAILGPEDSFRSELMRHFDTFANKALETLKKTFKAKASLDKLHLQHAKEGPTILANLKALFKPFESEEGNDSKLFALERDGIWDQYKAYAISAAKRSYDDAKIVSDNMFATLANDSRRIGNVVMKEMLDSMAAIGTETEYVNGLNIQLSKVLDVMVGELCFQILTRRRSMEATYTTSTIANPAPLAADDIALGSLPPPTRAASVTLPSENATLTMSALVSNALQPLMQQLKALQDDKDRKTKKTILLPVHQTPPPPQTHEQCHLGGMRGNHSSGSSQARSDSHRGRGGRGMNNRGGGRDKRHHSGGGRNSNMNATHIPSQSQPRQSYQSWPNLVGPPLSVQPPPPPHASHRMDSGEQTYIDCNTQRLDNKRPRH
jgi:hypothetical protein